MFSGDTIRLGVKFKDFKGKSIKPTDIKLTIYDTEGAKKDSFTQNIIEDDDGYYYDYVVVKEEDFIFEFHGIHNTYPVLARQLQKVKFN